MDSTTRDLRQYKTELGKRQKPASVNAALRRLFNWAAGTERIVRNPAQYLTDVAAAPLAPKGFADGSLARRRTTARWPTRTSPCCSAPAYALTS
jgi:hypothetical protein